MKRLARQVTNLNPKEGDIAVGCTIQFSDYSCQVARDRSWDQMYALMLAIVAAQTKERSPHTSAESDDAEEEQIYVNRPVYADGM